MVQGPAGNMASQASLSVLLTVFDTTISAGRRFQMEFVLFLIYFECGHGGMPLAGAVCTIRVH